MSKKHAQHGQTLIQLTAKHTVWRSYHPQRPAPTIQGRHWYSAQYVIPMGVLALNGIVINGEVVFDFEKHGRRSSGVLLSGGTWKLQRRFIAGECVGLTLEIQNTMIRRIRKKATKVALVAEVV